MLPASFRRQISGRIEFPQPFLEDLSCRESRGGCTLKWDPCQLLSLPFCAQFCKEICDGRLLAVGDEEGTVSVVNAAKPLSVTLSEARLAAQWQAHQNAVFDLEWLQGDSRLITASGDKTLSLWDTLTASRLGRFCGHVGSVRSVCGSQRCPHHFASGGRDGAVMVWDARQCPSGSTGDAFLPVCNIQDAHRPNGAKSPAMKTVYNRVQAVESVKSVTAVLFLSEDTVLATACAADETVKLWDMRKLMQPCAELASKNSIKQQQAAEVGSIRASGSSRPYRHGVTCLALDHTGSRLLVSVRNNVHYLYDVLRPHLPARAEYVGHSGSSFYTRACFSPDATHFVSGSSDANAYIWQVDEPLKEPLQLEGHLREVTAVAWSTQDPCQLVTCGDDHTVKIWNVSRGRGGPKLFRKTCQEGSPGEVRRRPVVEASGPVRSSLTSPPPLLTPLRTPLATVQPRQTPQSQVRSWNLQGAEGANSGQASATKLTQSSIKTFFARSAHKTTPAHACKDQEHRRHDEAEHGGRTPKHKQPCLSYPSEEGIPFIGDCVCQTHGTAAAELALESAELADKQQHDAAGPAESSASEAKGVLQPVQKINLLAAHSNSEGLLERQQDKLRPLRPSAAFSQENTG